MRPAELASLLDSGLSLQAASRALGNPDLTSLQFAIDSGAPLAPVLRQMEQQLRNSERAQAELSQALAVPRATRKLLIWLPGISLFFALGLGLTSFSAYLNPLVQITAVIGLALLYVGSKITARQLKSAEQLTDVSNLQDFLAAAQAGLSLARISKLRPALTRDAEVARLTALSQQTGAALIPLIEDAIDRSLANQHSEQIEKLRQLSVRILIPLGLTTLPAFLLFTIPPILVGSLK